MELLPVRYKIISQVEGLENYEDYLIDVEGNVWSTKNKKLKKLHPGWAKRRDGYRHVALLDKFGGKRTFYVHRLMAMAFLSARENDIRVRHENRIAYDNRIENLSWYKRGQPPGKSKGNVTGIVLDDSTTEYIKKIHSLSHHKGVRVSDIETFTRSLIENGLNEHVNRYGLRRLLT